jgi:MoaA/NifB/PqqE/SkfB family radical SAM enzyme
MYIQLTERCNMACAHCGMNCTEQGEDMSFDTFKQALEHASCVTLGGGEPTIHPQFEKFLMYAIAHMDFVFVITNGSMTDISLAMANMKSDTFSAELSQDAYHDPIDECVVRAYELNDAIRNTTMHNDLPIKAGRCDWGVEDTCICEGDPFVKPNGDVYQCGCDDSPCVGTVFDEYLEPIENEYNEWICHKNCGENITLLS